MEYKFKVGDEVTATSLPDNSAFSTNEGRNKLLGKTGKIVYVHNYSSTTFNYYEVDFYGVTEYRDNIDRYWMEKNLELTHRLSFTIKAE